MFVGRVDDIYNYEIILNYACFVDLNKPTQKWTRIHRKLGRNRLNTGY